MNLRRIYQAPPWLAAIAILAFALSVWCFYPVRARQTATPQVAPSPTPKALAPDNPWKDYYDAYSKDREAAQNEAKAQIERVERLQDRIFVLITGLGLLLLGFIYFLFGQTREQVKLQLSQELRQALDQDVAQMKERTAAEFRAQSQTIIRQLVGLQIEERYKQRSIKWLAATASTEQMNWVDARLIAMGFSGVEFVRTAEGLAGADLAILNYARDPQMQVISTSLALLTAAANWLRRNSPETPLVIACPSNSLQAEEHKALKGLVYIAANFDSAVITQTLTLLHR